MTSIGNVESTIKQLADVPEMQSDWIAATSTFAVAAARPNRVVTAATHAAGSSYRPSFQGTAAEKRSTTAALDLDLDDGSSSGCSISTIDNRAPEVPRSTPAAVMIVVLPSGGSGVVVVVARASVSMTTTCETVRTAVMMMASAVTHPTMVACALAVAGSTGVNPARMQRIEARNADPVKRASRKSEPFIQPPHQTSRSLHHQERYYSCIVVVCDLFSSRFSLGLASILTGLLLSAT
jgi:hypothetical protein